MNWRKELHTDPHLFNLSESDEIKLISYIETEIIEKLIEDIPVGTYKEIDSDATIPLSAIKQQLREKWL